MRAWFARSVTRLGHLSDETMARLISGELSSYREFRVNTHLNKCWQCKARREALEKASFQVVEYRKSQLERCLPLNPRRRQEFFKQLDEVWEETSVPSWRFHLTTYLRALPASLMNPAYASTFVVAIAAVLLFFIWHRNPPAMSSRTFLAQAVQAQTQQQSATTSGVIYQKVRVRAGARTVERAIYRDAARKRKPRVLTLKPDERALQTELVSGGVDWDQPLSAHDYASWHERQSLVRDEVRPSGQGLLTLTSTVPSGPVVAESLTVRVADFHPVQRTVAMRDSENIEIAEVHYDVLGWDAVSDALFEPLDRAPAVPAIASAWSNLLSPEQLDLAELQARLVLNRLNADSTENLEFSRTQTRVEVKGIVEDTQRRNELVAELKRVPHVSPAIFSIEELKARRDTQTEISSVKAYSAVGQPSPLVEYFKEHGKNQDDAGQLSGHLLDAAASAKQASAAISDLLQRFSADSKLGESGRAALTELIGRYSAKLTAALNAEDSLIVSNFNLRPSNQEAETARELSPASLSASAEQNMTLCRELAAGNTDSSQRPAAAIASDLWASTQQIRTMLRSLPSQAIQQNLQPNSEHR